MAGDMNAIFSLALSQEGAIILEEAFKQGGKPVGVVGDFKYTALRPALDVEIKANFKRIYDHLSMGIDLTAGVPIGGVPVYLDVGLDFAFEKLKQDGVIEIKVINFSTDEGQGRQGAVGARLLQEPAARRLVQADAAADQAEHPGPGGGAGRPAAAARRRRGLAGGGGASPGGGGACPAAVAPRPGAGRRRRRRQAPAAGRSSPGGAPLPAVGAAPRRRRVPGRRRVPAGARRPAVAPPRAAARACRAAARLRAAGRP